MKLISFAVPSYNSQDYLSRCVDTLLTGGEEVEVLIINDGSRDETGAIADDYQNRYPTIVRAIHKENGGHGTGVNRGCQEATGLYFKVVDSDDWLEEASLKVLLETLRRHYKEGRLPDLYVTDFIYDHSYDKTFFRRGFCRQLPIRTFFGWEQVGRFFNSRVLLMHSLLYRTQLLRESDTVLPAHTFYVDNIFAYKPLPFVKTLYYLDIPLYHYMIGRDDQSVNIRNFSARYDQQIRVMQIMLDAYSYRELNDMPAPLRRYMLHVLSAIMMNTMLFCTAGGKDERRVLAHRALWEELGKKDPDLYRYLSRRGLPAIVKWMPWGLRGGVLLVGYRVLCKIVKLG